MDGIPLPTGQIQQQQSTAAQGVDLIKELLKEREALTTSITGYSKEATTPIAGTGPGTSAGIAIPQVRGFEPTPLIDKYTVGARSTRDKGIANTIIAAANIAGKYEHEHEIEKQRVLAVDIERLFQAQDGVKQAQQTLQLDPNNADAKSTIEKNNQIIDALLNDPKKRKSISKALDISFTDPTKNDQMEHGALKMASDSYAQQFEKQTPKQLQPNIVAQQKLALAQAQQQSIDKMIGQIVPVVTREQGAWDRAQFTAKVKENLETYKQGNENARKQADIQASYKRAIDVANIHSAASLRDTLIKADQSAKNTQAIIDNKMAMLDKHLDDPVYQFKSMSSVSAVMKVRALQIKSTVDSLTKQKDNLVKQIANDVDKDNAKKQLQAVDEALKATNAEMNELNTRLKATSDYTDALGKAISSGNTKSTAIASGTVGESEDSDEDNSDETDPDK